MSWGRLQRCDKNFRPETLVVEHHGDDDHRGTTRAETDHPVGRERRSMLPAAPTLHMACVCGSQLPVQCAS